jgi:hypothetical protein
MSEMSNSERQNLEGLHLQHSDGRRLVVSGVVDGEVHVKQLGDRLIKDCPVEYGDACIDPECDGRIGEILRDKETQSAHELYCYGCGLNWVEGAGGHWRESYADWPTSFEFENSENPRSKDTDTNNPNTANGGSQ